MELSILRAKHETRPARGLGPLGREMGHIERIGSDNGGLHEGPGHSVLLLAGRDVPHLSRRLSRGCLGSSVETALFDHNIQLGWAGEIGRSQHHVSIVGDAEEFWARGRHGRLQASRVV